MHVSSNNQTVKKARDYLSIEHFSCSGHIGHLAFDKFTQAQAAYGAHHTRSC